MPKLLGVLRAVLRVWAAPACLIVGTCLIPGIGCAANAQGVRVTAEDGGRVFRMDGADVTYVIGVNDRQQLETLYWGKRLLPADPFAAPTARRPWSGFDLPTTITPHEFVGWGGGLYLEPDLKITFPDGNRDLELNFLSYKIDGDELSIVMKDISLGVYVTLHYAMDAETGIVKRWAEIENRTNAPFMIEQVAAGTFNLPSGTDYHLHFLTGRWAGEWTVQDEAIRGGKIVIESRRGSTGAQNNPFFAVDRDTSKSKEQDEVRRPLPASARGKWRAANRYGICFARRQAGCGVRVFAFQP